MFQIYILGKISIFYLSFPLFLSKIYILLSFFLNNTKLEIKIVIKMYLFSISFQHFLQFFFAKKSYSNCTFIQYHFNTFYIFLLETTTTKALNIELTSFQRKMQINFVEQHQKKKWIFISPCFNKRCNFCGKTPKRCTFFTLMRKKRKHIIPS